MLQAFRYHGKQAKKIAFQLLDEGLIHVIYTDTHRATGFENLV